MKPNGFDILARQDALTEDDWYKLVEIRQAMLTPLLREMTLKELGAVKMINDYFGTHDLRRDNPEIVGGRFDLTLRGIFPDDSSYAGIAHIDHVGRDMKTQYATKSVHRFWGLTRNNEWVTIEVHTSTSNEPYKYAGRTEKVQKALKVIILEKDIRGVCAIRVCHPKAIWERLGGIVKEWVRHREYLYSQVTELTNQFETEEILVKLLTKK